MSLNPKQIAGLVLLLAGIAVLACVPFLVGRYLVSLFISMLAFSVLTMAWSAFSGPTRYISLATSAFYGGGIYCVAIFNETMPLPLILVLAALVSFGLALLIGCAIVALSGIALWQFWLALILLGVGWNFGFIGATAMVAETYTAAEKNKVQGAHDFALFGTVAFASLMSGQVYNAGGWDMLNWIIFPVALLCIGALAALLILRERGDEAVS